MRLAPAEMKRVDMVILQKDVRQVTTALGELGVLHLLEVKPEDTSCQRSVSGLREELEKYKSLLARLELLREKLDIVQLPAAHERASLPVAGLDEKMSDLEKRADVLAAERESLQAESAEIQEQLALLDAFRTFPVPLTRIVESPFLHFAIGTMKPFDLKKLAAQARKNILLLEQPVGPDKSWLVAITSRKGRFALESLLSEHAFVRQDVSQAPRGTPTTIIAGLENRLDEIRRTQRDITRQLEQLSGSARADVEAMRARLRLEIALLEAQMNFGYTSSTSLISGWLPADSVPAVSRRLLQETGGRAIFRELKPEEAGALPEDVPVLLKNHPLLRPFQLLVAGFGLPRYNEVQPTLPLAVSFLLMFGLMFGDVGHGVVLVVVGLVLFRRSAAALTKDLGVIIAFAGLSAVLFGFFYGSLFGKEVLPAIGFRPMEDVMNALRIPVALGTLIISMGVVLNIVNKFRAGDYAHGILDRFGVVGIVFYWGALGLGLKYLVLGSGPGDPYYALVFIALPLLLLFLREPILMLLSRRKHASEGAFAGAMQGAIEIMETLSGYLANTVSFARVGAFALAHAGLCMAIYSLEEVVRALPAGVLWSLLVLVLGNAVVVGLEGLIVFVQCMRLEYYEFFGKFLEGSGKSFKPFRIA